MSYATLMVHLQLGQSNAALLTLTADIARRYRANVIGIAACQPLLATSAIAGFLSAEAVQQDQTAFDREAREAEAEFRRLLAGHAANLDWRCASVFSSLADYIASEARSADVILTSPEHGGSLFSTAHHARMGDLAMQAGRPILLAPDTITRLQLDQVLIAWNDSREARRAILDALPLLELAAKITVAEVVHASDVSAARERLNDVVGWLHSHGISAESLVRVATGSDAHEIADIARSIRADAVVAGAYGHSRLHEWVLGGVTSNLLSNPSRLILLSR
ncbi:Nucleotide-binding universal stress protein, UspA family [Sphingomonas sp. YR710]|uniref:universal stress protein n=1 Tax=Sphingomonas sp. YR710 TaxID=1882773 RepID=UPI00088ADF7E|nr:universal stress protein [Sphingomonas sp. YR710]SDC42470.1 Nucleotide-binding universal stress protein, UspA family [Sphingomonas sp. YR710]